VDKCVIVLQNLQTLGNFFIVRKGKKIEYVNALDRADSPVLHQQCQKYLLHNAVELLFEDIKPSLDVCKVLTPRKDDLS